MGAAAISSSTSGAWSCLTVRPRRVQAHVLSFVEAGLRSSPRVWLLPPTDTRGVCAQVGRLLSGAFLGHWHLPGSPCRFCPRLVQVFAGRWGPGGAPPAALTAVLASLCPPCWGARGQKAAPFCVWAHLFGGRGRARPSTLPGGRPGAVESLGLCSEPQALAPPPPPLLLALLLLTWNPRAHALDQGQLLRGPRSPQSFQGRSPGSAAPLRGRCRGLCQGSGPPAAAPAPGDSVCPAELAARGQAGGVGQPARRTQSCWKA